MRGADKSCEIVIPEITHGLEDATIPPPHFFNPDVAHVRHARGRPFFVRFHHRGVADDILTRIAARCLAAAGIPERR